jgi:hypothetical protein
MKRSWPSTGPKRFFDILSHARGESSGRPNGLTPQIAKDMDGLAGGEEFVSAPHFIADADSQQWLFLDGCDDG